MKIAALIARILLGLVFLVFELNGFLHFMNGTLPPEVAGQLLNALVQSHYDLIVSAVELAGGLLPAIRMNVADAAEAVVPAHHSNCVGDSGRLTMSRNGFVSD